MTISYKTDVPHSILYKETSFLNIKSYIMIGTKYNRLMSTALLCMAVFSNAAAQEMAADGLPKPTKYPVYPDSTRIRGEKWQKEYDRKSDIAWKKALPIVKAEEKLGRPYRPWAAKPEDLIKADIPAFPGAEGGGMYTPGGRGGKVIVVTTLADDGPGSFREACETGGARTIVFNVAGVIKLHSPINIRAPYLTIAGQTAPGDGICITGHSVLIDTHDVIIRHMRFRRNNPDVMFRDDALGGNVVGNVIIDHCSGSWGCDENMSIYRHVYDRDGKNLKLPTVNVTMQNCIFSEALDIYSHAFGATIGGHNCMFNRNLFASNLSRNASCGMDGVFNFVNNVVFNWWNRTIDGGDHGSFYNIINNYYKPGPITPTDKPCGHRVIKPEPRRDKSLPTLFGKAYVNGNYMYGYPEVTKDNWNGGVQVFEEENCGEWEKAIRADQPAEMPNVTILPTNIVLNYVLENVGATLPQRDAVDNRVIEFVRSGKASYVENAPIAQTPYMRRYHAADSYKKGIITDPRQVGGLPEYNGTPRLDTDGDGMPDEWELAYGLNPNDPSDAVKDCNGDGYTNIEKYINGIDPTKKIDWSDLQNNQDTLAEKGKVM